MMKLVLSQPMLIGILGLPRSGTTILANVINSMDNGFCAVEPIWFAVRQPAQQAVSGAKTGTFPLRPIEQIPAALRSIRDAKGYAFAACKETYGLKRAGPVNILLAECDVFLAIFRDPVSTFSSWRTRQWAPPWDAHYYDVNAFLADYRAFVELAHDPRRRVCRVKHESLFAGGVEYLNTVIPTLGRIEGTLTLAPMQISSAFGDRQAKFSAQLNAPALRRDGVTPAEIELIQRELQSTYEGIDQPKPPTV
jgi:hypothetical protein